MVNKICLSEETGDRMLCFLNNNDGIEMILILVKNTLIISLI